MPSRNHSRAAHNLSGLLYAYRQELTVHQQLSLNLDGWQVIPDLCAYRQGTLSSDWETDDDECTVPPLLVIEILSPKQNLQPLVDKIREYLRHGVSSCWLVEPATRVVSVFPSDGRSKAYAEGTVRDEPVGIEVQLGAIFT